MKTLKKLSLITFLLIQTTGFSNEASPKLDTGNTAWMLISTALVFFMIPGLAFFYGGMARRSSVLHTMMKSFVAIGVGGLVWILAGYSLVFGPSQSSVVGSLKYFGLNNINADMMESTGIPTYSFVLFQGMFAVIAVALISGAIIERTKFISYLVFIVFWLLLVYAPTAHWTWSSEGWLYKLGVLDLAGGTVIHISAGVSAVIAALIIGPRENKNGGPHNIPYVLLGTGILWFGWFGFNGGSVLAANGTTALALVTTFTASCAGFVTWLFLDIIRGKKPSAVGAAIGAVVGLVAITPAASFVTPVYSVLFGILGVVASYFVLLSKEKFPFDDVLDVFACHGIGGITGALLTGFFAFSTGSGKIFFSQVSIQLLGVLSIAVYAAIMSSLILFTIKALFGLRIKSPEKENLDLSIDEIIHGELGYGEFTKIKSAETN